ncbi:MAG TPA: aspartate aminotransferase family protein [Methylomirabilota bacterium]|jgi:glutamate-1-semialdehyde 2,1-aminomutase|nr:aspartate aminotransferase family protein [Methylomirabilota bacterium]
MGANRFLDPGSASARLFDEARRLIPGGTSKANFDVRPHPFYFVSGRGCRVTDADGVERLDALNNFTALIHGHAFPPVVARVTEQLARGTAFAASTPEEIALARLLVDRVLGLEQIRFGNSGTEAVMMAIKAARAFTGRDRIAKFEGAYHGYYDDVQVSFNSGPGDWGPPDEPASVPSSGGVPKHRVLETLVLPWNDREATERLLTRFRNEVAAVLVDPLANRMGFIPPAPGFLDHLREVTRGLGILVIFDEVISFRVSYGGAQERYGGQPDLTAFGKIVGGGFPIGATGGRAEVMAVFDPGTRGPRIASGGTFSANPVSTTAGLATLESLDRDAFARLEAMGARLRAGLGEVLGKSGVPGVVMGDASLFRFLMTADVPRTYRDTVEPVAGKRLSRLFMHLLDAGVLVGANGLGCLSTPMGDREIDEIVESTARALHALSREG